MTRLSRLSGRSRRAAARLGTGLSLAVTVTSVLACSAGPSVTRQVATAAPTARPSGPQAIRVGTASPGSWETTLFEPTLTFTIASDGWMFFFQDDDDEMALGNSGGIEITASRVSKVVDPSSHKGVSAPDDLVAWLASHPALDAETPQPATIAGIDSQSIEVAVRGGKDVDVFAFPTGNLRVAAGSRARIWVVPYAGPDLIVIGFAPVARFEESRSEIQSVVDSMEIEPT